MLRLPQKSIEFWYHFQILVKVYKRMQQYIYNLKEQGMHAESRISFVQSILSDILNVL